MSDRLIDILKNTIKYYEKRNIIKNKVEAVFSSVLKLERIQLYTNYDRILTQEEKNFLRETLKKNFENNNIFNKDDETIYKLLEVSKIYLEKNNILEAKLKAEIVFSKVLDIDRMQLFIKYNEKIDDEKKNKIRNILKKIAIDKIPIQYIFNEQNFYGYTFYVDSSVLIPRFDTEILVDKVLENLRGDETILDIGTGSGIIGITIAKKFKNTKVILSDISEKAINVAKINIKNLNVDNVDIIKSDVFNSIENKQFDIIVSNPPYIDKKNEKKYMTDDTIYEPEIALYAEEEGYYFYERISKEAVNYLKDDGEIYFEIGFNQAIRVSEILKDNGYKEIEIIKDLDNNDRVVKAKR